MITETHPNNVSRVPWLISLLCLLLVPAAILWIDRPLALTAHEWTRGNRWAILANDIPLPLFFLINSSAFLLISAVCLLRKSLSAWLLTFCLTSIAIVSASIVHRRLKYTFGRTWTETWVNDNPSFIRDGIFSFHFFGGNDHAFRSFPSGHLTLLLALCTVLMMRHPRCRPFCILAIILSVCGQLAANFHWASDILAGMAIGIAAAQCVLTLHARWGR